MNSSLVCSTVLCVEVGCKEQIYFSFEAQGGGGSHDNVVNKNAVHY